MKKLDWRQIALYAAFTGLAGVVYFWFALLIADKTGAIGWAILIAGATAAFAIVSYLTLRWFISSQTSSKFEEIGEKVGEVAERFAGGDQPVSHDELRSSIASAGELVVAIKRPIILILSFMMLMTVTLEIVALVNAGVMYLQTLRIEEQNKLFERQNRTQDSLFLTNSVAELDTLAETLIEVRKTLDLETSLSLDEDVIGEFVTAMSGGDGNMTAFRVEICGGENEPCANTTPFELAGEIGAKEELVVDAGNYEGVRQLYRLYKSHEAFGQFIVSNVGTLDSDIRNDLSLIETRFLKAGVICGVPNSNRIATLWSGVSGAGYAALEMWPIDSLADIEVGSRFDFSSQEARVNFFSFAASLGLLAEELGYEIDAITTTQDAADILAEGALALKMEINALQERCTATVKTLEDASQSLWLQRQAVVKALGRDEKRHRPPSPKEALE